MLVTLNSSKGYDLHYLKKKCAENILYLRKLALNGWKRKWNFQRNAFNVSSK